MVRSESLAPEQRQASGVSRQRMKLVNPDPRYGKIKLIEPTTAGYLHVAAAIQPRRPAFLPTSRRKGDLLARLMPIVRQLEQLDAVQRVTMFDAVAMPPARRMPYIRERAGAVHVADYDLVVLIETTSPASAYSVKASIAYQTLLDAIHSQATDLHVLTARNAKRIGDVDETRPGVFLFNYFVADDREVMLELWDYLGGWYAVETGIDNSTLLVPLEGERSDYLAINHARWDGKWIDVARNQVSKRSFWTYVLANLAANHVGAMPILYRVVDGAPRSKGRMFPWVMVAAAGTLGAGLALKRLRGRPRLR
jgi:hypothetical protein